MTLWKLRWVTEDSALEHALKPGEHILGSAAHADIKVSDRTVSRRHCELVCTDHSVTVKDLKSTNGTQVDGKDIDQPTVISGTSKLKVGSVVITVSQDQPATAPPPQISEASDISSGASVLLGPATVGFLRDAGQEVAFAEGDVIVRRGEHQDFFYVVIEGQVELLLNEGESRKRPLARLGEGGIFGAESVLAKEGAAIDAVAVTDVRLLRYPASALPSALQESASLRRKLLGGFARNLHKTTADALDLLKGTEVIARLVQGDSDPHDLVAASPRMKAIRKKIAACSEQTTPVLIAGEDGTGKTLVARLMHDGSARSNGPLIAVNCHELSTVHAAELILGEDLGGRLPSGERGSGGIHLAHTGTLVLRGADDLETAVQHMLAAFISARARKPPGSFPDTRIILTTRSTAPRADGGGLSEPLREACEESIEIPPLAKRPKDILPLAESFLDRHGPDRPVINEAARHALLSLRYRRRNVAELSETIDLAVRVADGPEIRPEHIFGGVGEDAAPPGLSINDTPVVRGLLRRTGLPLLRWGTLAGFAAVIVLCLTAASTVLGRVANTAIWSLWEPTVFALFLVAGPVWCTICPLSTVARFTKRFGASDRPPPAWLIRHGPWLAILGFALIIWVERVFGTTENPVPSGFLLLSLVAAAVLGAMLFRREVWCRHLCPLGRLATTLAPASPLQLTAKQRVCASTCTTHSCYKGTPDISGCTVFHHPLEAKQNYRCKLCLDCLQSCPHNSAQVQVRAPMMAVWRLDAAASDLAMFSAAITIFALGVVASRSFEVLSRPLHFTILSILCLAAGIALHFTVMAFAATDRRKGQMVQLAMSMMILGWSALMVSQLANIAILNRARVVIPATLPLPSWWPLEVSLIMVLQIGLVLVALAVALFSVGHIRFERSSFWTRIGKRMTPLLLVGYAAATIALLLF